MKLAVILLIVLFVSGCAGVDERPVSVLGQEESQTADSGNPGETVVSVAAADTAPADETPVEETPASEEMPETPEVTKSEEEASADEPVDSAEDESQVVIFDSAEVPMLEPAAEKIVVSSESIEQPEIEYEEPPPPLPDPLSSRQINNLIFTRIGPGLLPVHRSGSALYVLHDLDGNGYNDVFALAVRGEKRELAEFSNIHDYTRLYSSDRVGVKFYLRLFYQREGTLVPADLVSLGERFVVDSFAPQAVVLGANTPFAVSIVFTTLQGRVREWVLYPGGKPTRFSIQERTGELPRIEDIDGDGVIDVVMYEEDFEAGVGNEIYMTWYRWSGENYTRFKTVNIVRNLQRFLEDVFSLISDEEWDTVAEYALLESAYADFLSSAESAGNSAGGADRARIFRSVFSLASAGEAFRNTEITMEEDIFRAVYPEIRENPFSQRDADGFFFPITVRFETGSGRNHLYTARVYMNTDPFGQRQFFFGTD